MQMAKETKEKEAQAKVAKAKMLRIRFSACGAGGGIEPGVKRSETPGIRRNVARKAREAGGSLL
jgi:hypothetical protein